MREENIHELHNFKPTKVTAGDINIYHARKIADQQITYIIELAGLLDIERFETSLAELIKNLPIIKTTLKVHRSHIIRIPANGGKLSFSVVSEPDDPKDIITKFVSAPCDPEREYPLKIVIVRSKNEDTLCVKIDHVLSDAAGLKYILYLLADAYTNGSITLPINYNRGHWQIFRNFLPIKLIQALLKSSVPRPGATLMKGPFSIEDVFTEHVALEPGIFKRLRSKAKKSEATVNDMLLTAVYRTVFKNPSIKEGVEYPMMVPVDMRRYLPDYERGVIANLSSALYPAIRKIEAESFSDTLLRIKKCMNAFKKAAPGLGPMVLMTIGASFGGKIIKKRYETASTQESRFINLTNFGIVDEAQLLFDRIPVKKVYGIGPIQYAPGLLLVLSTFQDTLNLVVQANDTQNVQPFVRDFLTGVVKELENYT